MVLPKNAIQSLTLTPTGPHTATAVWTVLPELESLTLTFGVSVNSNVAVFTTNKSMEITDLPADTRFNVRVFLKDNHHAFKYEISNTLPLRESVLT